MTTTATTAARRGEEDAGDVGEEEGEGDEADEVGRLVDMGFTAHEAEEALRISRNDVHRALAILRSGRVSAGGEAVRALHERLRSLAAFHALQQVVRVDPQIMLVLNTEVRRTTAARKARCRPSRASGLLRCLSSRDQMQQPRAPDDPRGDHTSRRR